MFVDASAIVAILTREPEHSEFTARIGEAKIRLTSPLALYEATLGISRKQQWSVGEARALVDEFLSLAEVDVISIGEREYAQAVDAHSRFGRGRHRAGLNMGDCFAYACAVTHGQPLLFKGDDFPQTDIAIA